MSRVAGIRHWGLIHVDERETTATTISRVMFAFQGYYFQVMKAKSNQETNSPVVLENLRPLEF
jgi:hypothetical protein